MQGYNIGALNHTGEDYCYNGGVLQEVVVTAIRPSLAQRMRNFYYRVSGAAVMTGMWATGLGQKHMEFHYDLYANSLKNSPGIVKAVNEYYATGKTSDHCDFGLKGLVQAGLDPMEQFVGSYRYTIKPIDNGYLDFTVTNTTSFASFSYHLWPYEWNWQNGPMSNFKQTYRFIYP